MNASRILPGLWQGAAPRNVQQLHERRVQALVLCAREHQPPAEAFPGVTVLRCPLEDDISRPLGAHDLSRAAGAALWAAGRLRAGQRVLITCAMGLNRSGLVTAIVVHLVTGAPGRECVERVQHRRPGALFNARFVEALQMLGQT